VIFHTEIRDAIDRLVDNRVIRELYREWVGLAGPGHSPQALPPYSAFDSGSRPLLAGYLMVLAPETEGYRYRYYGANIVRASGFDMTGRSTADFQSEVGQFFAEKYAQTLATGMPLGHVRQRGVILWTA
jgi:hypothetical protein